MLPRPPSIFNDSIHILQLPRPPSIFDDLETGWGKGGGTGGFAEEWSAMKLNFARTDKIKEELAQLKAKEEIGKVQGEVLGKLKSQRALYKAEKNAAVKEKLNVSIKNLERILMLNSVLVDRHKLEDAKAGRRVLASHFKP